MPRANEQRECVEGHPGLKSPSIITMWHVYILKCGNGSYYVGHTRDLLQRVDRHSKKQGARHTAQNSVVDLLYHEKYTTEADAVRRELQIKRWSRAKKEALMIGDRDELHRLSKSRD
jgi:predicted GIY-YIG superfamily endonuclease